MNVTTEILSTAWFSLQLWWERHLFLSFYIWKIQYTQRFQLFKISDRTDLHRFSSVIATLNGRRMSRGRWIIDTTPQPTWRRKYEPLQFAHLHRIYALSSPNTGNTTTGRHNAVEEERGCPKRATLRSVKGRINFFDFYDEDRTQTMFPSSSPREQQTNKTRKTTMTINPLK